MKHIIDKLGLYRQTTRVWILNENKPGSAFSGAKMPETKGRRHWSQAFLRLKRHVLVYFHSDSRREGV